MICRKDTRPELIIRRILFKNGIRFRVNVKSLKGTPDIVLKKYNTIIFINGCFWHGHKNCNKFVVPKTRTKWWLDKIETNIVRDKRNIKYLKNMGWKVIVLWECQLQKSTLEKTVKELIEKLKSK